MDPSKDIVPRDAAILSRVVRPDRDDLSPEAARSILGLTFDQEARARTHELAVRAQAGDLTADEASELDSYRRVGRLVDLLHSKARLSLKRAGVAA